MGKVNMCKLKALLLQNGKTIQVADHKWNHIRRYLQELPKLKSVQQVILFGSAITEDCTEQSDVDLCFLYDNKKEYWEDIAKLNFELMPESASDDALCADQSWYETTNCLTGAWKDVRRKGVTIYDRNW